MSSDLLRKQSRQGSNGQTVLPQAVSNPSIIESVAGFIHEVVPQAYSSVLPGETRESISWARFEVTDYNDPENYASISESESESIPPLLLVLGYNTGVQVWSINGSGDATELLSWSQGAVRTLRLLDRPKDGSDLFINKRPLVAVVDSSGPGPQFCTVNFVSLKTAEVIKSIKFKTPICDIHSNKKSVVITFMEKIAVFDIGTLEDRLTVTTCYPSPGACINPVALGSRWLAYAEKRLTSWQRSSGGCESDGSQSYTATVIHAAKSLSKGLRDLSGSLTGSSPSTTNNNAVHPGIVTIIDIELKPTKEDDPENLICHFVAHVGPIVAMTFDPSGLLLVTADKHGHRFHVYRIQPHPCCPQLASVHHLYILHRGETTARVQDITVSLDSRWVAVSSVRGTTHVFAITPYGGPVTVRTHTTPHVVNRLSRFERSAGLSDGRGSPLPEVPCQPSTPRLPPFPVPSVLLPLAQIRRTDESSLAAIYAIPRAWIPGQQIRSTKRSMLDSLFIISSGGSLIQYDLDPRPLPGIAKDKISYDTSIELAVDAKAEWPLLKPPYTSSLQPPLPSNNPLLFTTTLEHSVDPRSVDDRWMAQVEIVTHTGPHRRLWMGPQFSFKSIDPLVTSGLEINPQSDNMKPTKSNPVNMPHRPFLLVESGSAGSVESPHLTDCGSSNEDLQQGESRLREDLADAMLETATNSSGVLVVGAVGGGAAAASGGGRLRAAILERQVNPLGTVITLPAGGQEQQQSSIPTERLHHHHQHQQQLYHPVIPAPYQAHVKSFLQDDNIKVSSPLNVNVSCQEDLKPSLTLSTVRDDDPAKSASQISSSKVVKRKDKSNSSTNIIEVPTTCVEVQTTPIEDISQSKVSSTTLSKSIQTTSAEKKPPKSEQKVKNKNKKKSTNNQSGELNKSAKQPENISAQSTSSQSKTNVEKYEGKTELENIECTKSEEMVFKPKLALEKQSHGDPEGPSNVLKSFPREQTRDEVKTGIENEILSEQVSETVVCFNLLPELQETVREETEPEHNSDLIETPPIFFALLDSTHEPSTEGYNNEQDGTQLLFTCKSLIDCNTPCETAVVNEGDDTDTVSRVSEIETCSLQVEAFDIGINKDTEVDLLTNEPCINKPITDAESDLVEESAASLSEYNDEKVDDVASSEDCDQAKNSYCESSISDKGSTGEDTGGISSNNHAEKRTESIDLKSSVDLSSSSIELVAEILKYKSLNENLDYESGESSCQREESSVTGNEDLPTDSADEKRHKKELQRKVRLQEIENIKDVGEGKRQSLSPCKVEVKDDTESSDDLTSRTAESRSNTIKQVKRKKSGKKVSEHTTPLLDDESSSTSVEGMMKLKGKSHSEGTLDIEKSDYETCSEKKSDSSIESFPEFRKKQDKNGNSCLKETKSWSSIVKNTSTVPIVSPNATSTASTDKEPVKTSNSAEDRDSVYESCNDEDFPTQDVASNNDQVAFESSKEEFDEPKTEVVKIESSSSNTEEKTDSGEKDLFTSVKNLKKVKKQKKRKR